MASEYDPSEFVDSDFQSARKMTATVTAPAAALGGESSRAPSREEVEARVGDMHTKLAELRRAQQELERERADLEETRRRQAEFTKGRQEMEQHLTRGIGLLEESEFAARRDAEQMAKTLVDLREALVKIQSVQEESWTRDNFNTELTRALTAIENARMEWNSARLKFTVLNGETLPPEAAPATPESFAQHLLRERSYAELCKMGLALTWPLALVGVAVVLVMLLHR
jgi:DNA repair exonuclease SbcCD ATPase subunit